MEAIDPSLRGDGGNPDTTTGPTQNDSDVEREPDQDDGAPHDDTEAPAQGGHDDDGELEPTSDIQILDLHSDNPIISHRGHVFEGSWAEMVGTEVLLAPHEGDDGRGSLPALRHLPGDVDLLGASASRILTKRKTLHPRKPAEDSLAPTQREWNINIPVGKNKHGERAQQANFLEKLIALKIQRGDKDQVTVYAKDGVGKDFHDDRDPDFRPRRKRVRIRLDDEDDDGDEEHGGRPVARSGGTAAGQLARGAGSSQRSDADVLSVPTPKRWSDLEAGAGDEDEEEDEDDEMDQDGDGAQDEDEDVDDQDDDEEEDDDDDHELGDDTTMQAG